MRILHDVARRVGRSTILSFIVFLCMSVGIATAIADDATTTDDIATSTSTSTSDASISSSTNTSTSIINLDTTITSPSTTTASTTTNLATQTSISTASTSPATITEQLYCGMAYTSDLYDTPDGHLDPGYTLATSTTATSTSPIAHIIGTQSWEVCHDYSGKSYEFTLTPDEYSALGEPGAALPAQMMTIEATTTPSPNQF